MDTGSRHCTGNRVSMRSLHRNVKPTLIFLHIPKTAGTTLNRIIDREYGPSTVFSTYGPRSREVMTEFIEMSEAQRSSIRVLRGHEFFGTHEFFRPPVTYFTVLRDPVDRIVSHYHYVRRSPQHRFHRTVTSQNMSLKDYVCCMTAKELNNGQARLLSGQKLDEHFDFGQCSDELLEIAKKNLEKHFTLVGLTERFDETLILLKRSLGWRRFPVYIKKNVTQNRPLKDSLSTEVLNAIKRYNELDIELYAYTREKFNESINNGGADFRRELKIFNIINGCYQKFTYISRKTKALSKKYGVK
jgi:Galactose-3-O-sulfotransferase